jgi:hypothetical protein
MKNTDRVYLFELRKGDIFRFTNQNQRVYATYNTSNVYSTVIRSERLLREDIFVLSIGTTCLEVVSLNTPSKPFFIVHSKRLKIEKINTGEYLQRNGISDASKMINNWCQRIIETLTEIQQG